MKLFETRTQVVSLVSAPKMAGDAMIAFVESDHCLTEQDRKDLEEGKSINGLDREMWNQILKGLPTKNGSLIVFPKDHTLDFYPLMKGEQFLASIRGRTYFGGTDEKPFLAEIANEPLETFKESGEQAFYECLKPYGIIELEKQYGKEHTRRQGDFYTYPCFEAVDVLSFMEEKSKLFSSIDFKWKDNESVGKTRHTFTGHLVIVNKKIGEEDNVSFIHEYQLIKGVLNAPDHRPLDLLNWHYIYRSPSMHVEIHS